LALYDDTGFVSHHDAEQALEAARDYLSFERTSPRENHEDVAHTQRTWLNRHSLVKNRGLSCQQRALSKGHAVPTSRPGRNIFIFLRHIFSDSPVRSCRLMVNC